MFKYIMTQYRNPRFPFCVETWGEVWQLRLVLVKVGAGNG